MADILESTQVMETQQSLKSLVDLETSGFLDRIPDSAPATKAIKSAKTKSLKKTETKEALSDDTEHTSMSSGQEVPSDSHTDSSSQEFCPKKDTFQAQRRLSRTASKSSRSKQSAASQSSKSKVTNKTPQNKKKTPANRKLKKINSTGRFGTSSAVTPATSIAASSTKSKNKAKTKPSDKGKRPEDRPAQQDNVEGRKGEGRKAKRRQVTPGLPEQDDEEEGMTCHCGDPDGEDTVDPISVGCDSCENWFHGLCVG
jgi:hypothetical protein